MKFQNVKYIAFEGGGGKGIVYLGAVRALEVAKMLPLTEANRADTTNYPNLLQGIGGASAGAITTYFLALGMSGDEISEKTTEMSTLYNDKVKFYEFYDDPVPLLYKAVRYDKATGENVPCYAIEIPDIVREQVFNAVGQEEEIDTGITTLTAAKFYDDFGEATTAAENLFKRVKNIYTLGLPKFALRILGARNKLDKLAAENQVVEKLRQKKDFLIKYLYSLLMDRGLFCGQAIRNYLQELTFERIVEFSGGKDLEFFDIPKLTFKRFYEITGNDLRIAGVNITRAIPVYFSRHLTPDFPIIEAICMSMSIPFAFKPTMLEGTVNKNLPQDDPYNVRYRGYYVDGGTLNNLPIHAFDYANDEDNFNKYDVGLLSQMFGIRCTGGFPTDAQEDAKFCKDNKYDAYFKSMLRDKNKEIVKKFADRKKRMDQQGNCVGAEPEAKGNTGNLFEVVQKMSAGAFTPILGLAGNLYNTLMYGSEDGQIRTEAERKQTMELFSYDVGLFDFSINDDLSQFTQVRALIKVGAMLGIPQQDIENVVLEKYYSEQDAAGRVQIKDYIKNAYAYFTTYKSKNSID